MTIEELVKKNPLVAFGEGDARLGYSQADNWEPAERKLRHAFWKDAVFEPVKDKPGCYLATLKDSETKRVVFVK